MPRRPAIVTQADVARIARALKVAGADRVRVVIEGGRVIVEEAPERDPPSPPREPDDDSEAMVL